MADQFVRRSADDYAQGLDDLHPVGAAWPRAEAPAPGDDTPRGDAEALSDITRGLAKVWGDKVDARAADLLFLETDPRQTVEMLPDWERAFGLPDACNKEAQTIATRRDALVQRLTLLGRQDIPFFVELAADLGYRIKIYEYRPVVCGLSRCGETRPSGQTSYSYFRCGTNHCSTEHLCEIKQSGGDDWIWRIGPPNIRYVWRVAVLNTSLRWFHMGTGRCGVDHHCEFGLATDLECLFRRLKPGHGDVLFDYSQMAIGNA